MMMHDDDFDVTSPGLVPGSPLMAGFYVHFLFLLKKLDFELKKLERKS